METHLERAIRPGGRRQDRVRGRSREGRHPDAHIHRQDPDGAPRVRRRLRRRQDQRKGAGSSSTTSTWRSSIWQPRSAAASTTSRPVWRRGRPSGGHPQHHHACPPGGRNLQPALGDGDRRSQVVKTSGCACVTGATRRAEARSWSAIPDKDTAKTVWQHYIQPADIDEVLRLLAQHGERARVVAGATDLMLELERGVRRGIDVLLDITRLPGLKDIRLDAEGRLHLGALVTHNDCVASTLIRSRAFPLARAAWEVGAPQIRNRGNGSGESDHGLAGERHDHPPDGAGCHGHIAVHPWRASGYAPGFLSWSSQDRDGTGRDAYGDLVSGDDEGSTWHLREAGAKARAGHFRGQRGDCARYAR